VLDASGRDYVIVETVGVGQDEVDIVRTADVSIVVLVPGTGDEVQALKAGIMEIADIFVVNKADREGADRMASAVEAMLGLESFPEDAWRPPILKTEATAGAGVPELVEAITRFRRRAPDRVSHRRRERSEFRLRELVAARFMARVDAALGPDVFTRIVDAISARTLDPYSAAQDILDRVAPDLPPPDRHAPGTTVDGH
jgi:LAO/AO transport system kinase